MYKLPHDIVIENDILKDIDYEGQWITIRYNYLCVKEGFEWNGCTGARDTKRTWIASCVHDALYTDLNVPLNRKQKDLIFYTELKRAKFKFLGVPASWMYYLGVRIFGGIFYRKVRQYE